MHLNLPPPPFHCDVHQNFTNELCFPFVSESLIGDVSNYLVKCIDCIVLMPHAYVSWVSGREICFEGSDAKWRKRNPYKKLKKMKHEKSVLKLLFWYCDQACIVTMESNARGSIQFQSPELTTNSYKLTTINWVWIFIDRLSEATIKISL